MIKYLLLAFLLINLNLNADDIRLERYANTQEWLKDADSNADSAYNLGYTYATKIEDTQKAIYWYKKSYAIDKNVEAANNLGIIYRYSKDYKEAIKWYKLGIDAGHGKSAFNLALLYEENLKDYPNTIKYYKKAYSLGHIGATLNLGLLYDETLKDIPNAIKWYKIGLDNKFNESPYNLAILYKKTLKDIPNAIKYYKKAIDLGHTGAAKGLAFIYKENGEKILAGAYYISLIDRGFKKEKLISLLKKQLKFTDKELQEAYKLQLKLDIPKHYRGGI